MDELQRISDLRSQLNEWSHQYYVLDAPTVSDYDYDMALRELEQLEAKHPETVTPDSPTQRVGGEALTSFAPVHHPVPLESLQDVFSDAEMLEFIDRIAAGTENAAFIRGAKGGRIVHCAGIRKRCFYPGRNSGGWPDR